MHDIYFNLRNTDLIAEKIMSQPIGEKLLFNAGLVPKFSI